MHQQRLLPAILLALVCGTTCVLADDAASPPAEVRQQVDAIRLEAAQFKEQETSFLEQGRQAQLKLQDAQQQLLKLRRTTDETQKALTEAQGKLKKEQEAATKTDAAKQQAETAAGAAANALKAAQQKVTEAQAAVDSATKAAAQAKSETEQEPADKDEAAKAEAAKQQAEKAAAAATKALTEAQQKATQTQKAAEEASKVATEAQVVVKKTEETIAGLTARIGELKEEATKSGQQVASAEKEIQSAIAAAKQAHEKFLERAISAEELLKQAGAWVSFSNAIAPIFQDRCLACHNARIAKGRYNMENYAAIMKGGESGAVIDAGDTDSLLCILIDDGSMPKDTDPLTSEQIAVVNRWVQLGAELDAGVDPLAPLLQIMPKRPQPMPPETYSAPIPITALAFSPDGTLLASAGYHEVLLWSVETGELVRRISNVAERAYAITFHPDGTRLAVASGTPGRLGEVKLFQVADGALLADLVTADDAMFDVAFSPDGQRLAAVGADRAIRVFDLSTRAESLLIEDHADWVLSIDWSPDGKMLVSGSRDKTCKLFDAATGESKGTFNGHGEVVAAAAFLADGKQIASGGRDKQLRIWKVSDTKEARKVGGFGDEITHLTMLPEDRVLTACADRKGRITNAGDGKTLHTLSGHLDWIYSTAAHPGSGICATGSYDGEIRLWKLSDASPVRQWIAKP